MVCPVNRSWDFPCREHVLLWGVAQEVTPPSGPHPPGASPLGPSTSTQRTEWPGKEDLLGRAAGAGVPARARRGPSLCGSHRPGSHAHTWHMPNGSSRITLALL